MTNLRKIRTEGVDRLTRPESGKKGYNWDLGLVVFGDPIENIIKRKEDKKRHAEHSKRKRMERI